MNVNAYSDALVVLGTSGILVPLVRRWGINPILGYLAAGALLGPAGLGLLAVRVPQLRWFTITDLQNVAGIAELGVVFLLFLIGIELTLKRLLNIRRLVFGLGGLPLLLTGVVLGAAALLLHQRLSVAIIIGVSLSLSSTAIVLHILSGQQRLSSAAGRASFAVLLAQDLAVVPLLLFIGLLHSASGHSPMRELLFALIEAVAGLGIMVFVGRWLMRPLFRMVAAAHSTDLFIAAVLFVIIGAGVAAHYVGLSMALGAFVAGLLLAETEYRKAIQAIVEPFKNLLLGIFFFTIGMNIDFRVLLREPIALVLMVTGLIVSKGVILTVLGRFFDLSWPAAVETGLLLGPCGEFAFVSIGLAQALGLIGSSTAAMILAATSVTMAILPLLAAGARRLPDGAAKRVTATEMPRAPLATEPQAIVIGYGRVGEVVCALLRHHGISSIAVDNDPVTVSRAAHHGHEVYYGDASSAEFLRACGIEHAAVVVITVGVPDGIDPIVSQVNNLRPGLRILSRARDLEHARHLYAVGISEVVHETFEASLQLSELVLLEFGVPEEAVAATIHERRTDFGRQLRSAATHARQPVDLSGV